MTVELADCVKKAVDCIISSEHYKTTPQIDVKQGSNAGDGYASKTYAISIKGDGGKIVELFVKYLPEVGNPELKDLFVAAFRTEFKFYDEIYPTFKKFQDKKSLKEPFNNVPKHYHTNINNCNVPPIVLENLRSLGYTLRDRMKTIDQQHLTLPIEAFARYHAISYVLKDQEPQVFQKLTTNIPDVYTEIFIKSGMMDSIAKCARQFLDSLDPIADKKCLDSCKNLHEVLIQHTLDIPQNVDEYAVIIQGDCWSINVMFLYDNETSLPIDVKLIDWQCQRVNSPLLDFSYFFYTSATKEDLDNANYYLKLYYNILAQRIAELGSDPKKLFPYDTFLAHWRKFALFGLTVAFCIVKIQLFEKDEVPDIINSTESDFNPFAAILKNQDKYIKRMKDIVEYFIDNELL